VRISAWSFSPAPALAAAFSPVSAAPAAAPRDAGGGVFYFIKGSAGSILKTGSSLLHFPDGVFGGVFDGVFDEVFFEIDACVFGG